MFSTDAHLGAAIQAGYLREVVEVTRRHGVAGDAAIGSLSWQ
ncbi:MAG TPA: hypothetical protein VIO57_03710 [Chloroflexota bacterium]